MLRSAAASWTLFFGLLLIMAANGLQVVLLGIEANGADFSNVTTGFVMAGYFLVILLRSLLVPKLLHKVGHVRVFGAMAALASAAVLVSLTVVPVLLSAISAPNFEEPERMSVRQLLQVSSLAVIGLGLNGVAVSMLFGMGAVYGLSIGLDSSEVGYFMTAPVLSALILQYPVGRLSDRFDRRMVIMGVAIMGGIAAGLATLFGKVEFAALLFCMLIYGGSLFPLYSLCIANANDFLTPRQMVAAASGLIMVNGGGAVLGSPLAAMSIELLGIKSFFCDDHQAAGNDRRLRPPPDVAARGRPERGTGPVRGDPGKLERDCCRPQPGGGMDTLRQEDCRRG